MTPRPDLPVIPAGVKDAPARGTAAGGASLTPAGIATDSRKGPLRTHRALSDLPAEFDTVPQAAQRRSSSDHVPLAGMEIARQRVLWINPRP